MITGIAASKGYAIGKVKVCCKDSVYILKKYIDSNMVLDEKERLYDSIDKCKLQIKDIKNKVKSSIGIDKAEIFESHIMLLSDPEFIGKIENKIENNISAECAVAEIRDNYLEIFKNIKDQCIKERYIDIKDVSNRLIKNLSDAKKNQEVLKEDTILVAHDLTPSDTAQLDTNKVIGILADIGGVTSHTSIVARSLDIPAIIGMKNITENVKDGDTVIVDAFEGNVIVNPDNVLINEYKKKIGIYQREKESLKKLVNKIVVTKSGKRINIFGNIAKPEDVEKVFDNGGEGIGLFRTEFLYMGRDSLPKEDEQFQAYKYVLEKMDNKPVVIRTFDIGGDKEISCLNLPKEINPFLGYRAIRLCLDRIDIFKTQLRALLRASTYGNLKIMFPMIASLDEFLKAKSILKQCKVELESENISFSKNIDLGIMVEVPSVAIASDEIAKHVDFFSIGTNDLIQYTLAVDRTNEKISKLYDPMHPAVLKLIKMTIDSAHNANKLCSMCGEMATYEEVIPLLVNYGLDEFSVNPSSILKVKKLIMNQ